MLCHLLFSPLPNVSTHPSKLCSIIRRFPIQTWLPFSVFLSPLLESSRYYHDFLEEMNLVNNKPEEQVSMMVDDYKIIVPDSESDSSSWPQSEQSRFFTRNGGMMKVDEESTDYVILKNCFLVGMGPFGKDTINVVAIHRNSYSSLSAKARLETFRIFSEAVANKSGGNANVKFGWYGGSKNEICNILSHGFTHYKQPASDKNGGLRHGLGIHLYPAKLSLDGALSAEVDENGMRHMLLCRVILGKVEEVCAGSTQLYPSSEEFDSGVDNIASPKRYIVWSSYMNSHILPSCIISFTAPSSIGLKRSQGSSRVPSSPYMSFPNLMSMLKHFLGPADMVLITKHHSAFQGNRITRHQLIQKVREIAGDDLLKAVIKVCRNKKLEARNGRSPAGPTN